MVEMQTLKRAVVTGGAGFIGSHVCSALLETGWRVECVDNGSTGRRDNLAGLLDNPYLRRHFADVSYGLDITGPVDLVLHLASPASPADYLRLPIETLDASSQGTRNALQLALEKSARFVFASTSEVYGDPLQHPQREDYWGNVNPIGPRAVYDEAKRFGEALVMAHRRVYDMNAGIVRIFNTYGPRMRANDGRAVPTFIDQALRGEPLTVAGDGTQTRALCYVDDTVRAILAIAASDHVGPVNIGNPHEITMLELARTILRVVGSSSPIEFIELPTDDPRVRCPDITRARQLLGWEPVWSLDDGLTATVQWFREQVAAQQVAAASR